MIEPDGLDDEARAELLCYLAVAQLVARARGGDWLRTDHLVESTRIWLTANGANAGWRERVRLGALPETRHRIGPGLWVTTCTCVD
ncbi:MAG: hypothetical protein OSB38_39270 [Paraburkholderia fungorum]|nr:hypothetical protein [Paraburkholderia fungorum]